MQNLFDASDRDIAIASFLMSNLVVGMLVQTGRLEPDEALALAALARKAARGSGFDGAAQLIESAFPDAAGLDADGIADDLGIGIQTPRKN